MSVRITLALLAYNQAQFIGDAARSALAQDCEPIQVILSDDCSSDDTYARIQAIAREYSGPHEVVVRRNERNLGMGRHFNAVMRLAAGKLIVLMAGDDVSLPGRVARTAQQWDASDQGLDLLAAHVFDMSEDGQDLGLTRVDRLQEWRSADDWARRRPHVIGGAHAVTRRLFDRFGPLADDVSHEDQVNVLRAVCSGGAYTIEEPLVRYRRGGISTAMFSPGTFRTFESRRNARHLAVFDQWIRDAAIADCEKLVERAIDWDVQRAVFLRQLLAASTLGNQLKLVTAPSRVEAGWRWKRLAQLLMPRATTMLKRLRSSRRLRPHA